MYFHLKNADGTKRAFEPNETESRPVAIITDTEIAGTDALIVKVKNARRALANAYFRFYGIDLSDVKLIGITGTNGKTTTAYLIEQILAFDGRKVGFIGSGRIVANGISLTDEYYSMTTPDPDLLYSTIKKMTDMGIKHIVMEVSSHALALDKLAPLTFDVAVFTNLSHEHLDFHGTQEEYYRSKMKLFSKSRLSIFNLDDSYCRRAYSECKTQKLSVGIIFDADVRAKEPVLLGFRGSRFFYRAEKFMFRMNLPLVGAYNIYNALFATAAVAALGVRPCVAKEAVRGVKAPPGRFNIFRSDVTVISDYAHTPEALENVLKTANSCKNQGQKLITVFGCGGERDKSKRPLMGRIAEELSDVVVITEDNSRSEKTESIINDILCGINDKSKAAVIPKRSEAIEIAAASAAPGDIILVLGKGAEKYNIDQSGAHPFDETKLIKKALAARSGSKKR